MGNGHIRHPKRRVSLPAKDKAVDYGLLKSMIRDEVDLQVNRKITELIKPLYQVIMQDSRHDLSMQALPDWARELLDADAQTSSDMDDILTSSDDDYWGL